MDHYSYLNQSFDPTTCPLSSPMDTISSACQLTCSGGYVPDLSSSCSQISAAGYGRYTNSVSSPINPMNGIRSNQIVQQTNRMSVAAAAAAANHMATGGGGIRTHHHHQQNDHHIQSPMFQTGIGLQSNYHHSIFQ
ncbi:hypothetical protein BLA29_013340 [Euroglyphus maynei]|uniref:Uncharacterized protein n=1 Tax=Euroglyphus maynei TaxID=6958 RepID=A0A1Y3BT59_EURMA|nr:hypothetical protein BLA29_013340 [Euroglyphus maynei]